VKIQKSSLSLDLWTFAPAAPTLHLGKAELIFRPMIQTIKFAD